MSEEDKALLDELHRIQSDLYSMALEFNAMDMVDPEQAVNALMSVAENGAGLLQDQYGLSINFTGYEMAPKCQR